MTKLKNTKKGMAKKALSISLVAAMLATSNVPVWAAEFTDGTDAVVEAPVVEEFTAEAPVVEETNDVAAYAANSEYDFSGVTVQKDIPWKNTGKEILSGQIKDSTGKVINANTVKFKWVLDGVQFGYEKDASELGKATSEFALTKADIGSHLEAIFYKADNSDDIIQRLDLGTIKPITVQATDVTLKYDWNYAYWGKYVEELPGITVNNSDLKGLNDSDFTWSHVGENGYNVGTVAVTGTLTDEAVKKYGYSGSLNTTYKIVAKEKIAAEDLDISVVNPEAGEYVNDYIWMDNSNVSVKLKGTEETLPVKEVITHGTNAGETKIKITLDSEKLNATKNYKLSSDVVLNNIDKANISARDLTKGTAKIYTTYAVGDIKSETSVLPKRVTLTGADGKTLTADKLGNAVTVRVLGDLKQYETPGTYSNAVEIKAAAGQENVKGTVYADLVIAKQSFDDNAKFLNGTFNGLKADPTELAGVAGKEYTGEEVTLTEKELGKFSPDGKSTAIDQSGFTFTYSDNVNASANNSYASITVAGKPGTDYEGCTKTFYFKINKAEVKVNTKEAENTVSTAAKSVSIKDDATSAADYKDAVALAIKAKNANKPAKEFTLTEDTDYTCEYKFVKKDGTALGADDDKNAVGNAVQVIATITNGNFKVANATYAKDDYKIVGNGTNKVTVTLPIVEKKLVNAEITLDKDSYVYTGKDIVPVVTVKADGKVLVKDKDYSVRVRNGLKAGTGTVIITTLADSEYAEGTEFTKDFTIAKANAEDVKVTVTTSDIKYDGKAWDGTRVAYTVKLGDVDVTSQFKAKWGENISAGKTAGKLTLTPNTAGSVNFTGTKEATFEIKGETVTGTLAIYDENGKNITTEVQTTKYFYSGSPITFDKVVFTGKDSKGNKLVEGKDFEIVYVDNVDAGTGHVTVVGKGNFVGDKEITKADGTKLDNVIGNNNDIQFEIVGSKFTAKDVTVKNGVYASGLVVKPQVTVVSNGKTLVEGIDYKLVYDTSKAIDATTESNIKVEVKGIHGYNGVSVTKDLKGNYLTFGIDKFDLANASVTSDGKTVTVRNGNVVVPSTEYTSEIKDGKATVTATTDNKNYTGTKTVDVTKEDTFVEAPVIKDVKVVGNKATVILEGECDGATGYDYVISTNGQSSDAKRLVNKNVLSTDTTFQYLQQGIYYAHCHAWKKVNGKKVFSAYSEARPFSVTSITPDQPSVTSVKVSKNTVKVTYTKSANATGYDLVLGKSLKKVNGEMRPVDYGKLVKKVYKGNTVTATFTKVPKGTYYVGLHAYNRTSEDGKKVFSPWSNAKKVVVK